MKPQRDGYVMERLIGDYFEEERGGKKRGGETESYSQSETEKEGRGGGVVRKCVIGASERKKKFSPCCTGTDCLI